MAYVDSETALVKRGVKMAAATMLELTGGRKLVSHLRRRSMGGRRVEILGWHRVVEDADDMGRRYIPPMFVSARTFDHQVAWLARNFHVTGMGEALEVLAGRRHVDRDVCVITFDDGYADFLEHALPVLRKHGVPATLYVPTGYVGTGQVFPHDRLYRALRAARAAHLAAAELEVPPLVHGALEEALALDPMSGVDRLLQTRPRSTYLALAEALEARLGLHPEELLAECRVLDWDELREVQANGVSIGGHSVDHACLPTEAPAEIERQVTACRAELEAHLGVPVLDFAYPNGWWSRGSVRALLRAGFRSAVTIESLPNHLGESPFTLKRSCIWEGTSRGPFGYSEAITACALDGAINYLGLSTWVPGERPDAVGGRPAGGSGTQAAPTSAAAERSV
jgi:peptidoglycan/xylan/chitin deacetylase (PgdA/CDA1 family)